MREKKASSRFKERVCIAVFPPLSFLPTTIISVIPNFNPETPETVKWLVPRYVKAAPFYLPWFCEEEGMHGHRPERGCMRRRCRQDPGAVAQKTFFFTKKAPRRFETTHSVPSVSSTLRECLSSSDGTSNVIKYVSDDFPFLVIPANCP
jgi:hypothetical protein